MIPWSRLSRYADRSSASAALTVSPAVLALRLACSSVVRAISPWSRADSTIRAARVPLLLRRTEPEPRGLEPQLCRFRLIV